MARSWPPDRTRLGSALAAAAIQCALAAVIVWGLAGHFEAPPANRSKLVSITPTRPEPSPAPTRKAEQGAAAPPAPKAKALPAVAPEPKVALATPRPAATVAGKGEEAAAGAALAGSGSGAGGTGFGTGAGAGGAGTGGGAASAPVRVSGALRDRDYPREAGPGGTVAISFRVRADGRVDGCRVLASSGQPMLDGLTCDLVEARFRYRPARDPSGRPIDYVLRTSFTWGLRQRG